jgi:transposase InsO family protein
MSGVGLLHHSDQGCTYASEYYQTILETRGIVCSMSRRGNCYDNAVMESFCSSVKSRPDRGFPPHPHPSVFSSTEDQKTNANHVVKPSTESDQAHRSHIADSVVVAAETARFMLSLFTRSGCGFSLRHKRKTNNLSSCWIGDPQILRRRQNVLFFSIVPGRIGSRSIRLET